MPTKAQDSVSVQSKTHQIMYSANPYYQKLRHVNDLLLGWASGGPSCEQTTGLLNTEPQVAMTWQVIKHQHPEDNKKWTGFSIWFLICIYSTKEFLREH